MHIPLFNFKFLLFFVVFLSYSFQAGAAGSCTVEGSGTMARGDSFSGSVSTTDSSLGVPVTGTWSHWTQKLPVSLAASNCGDYAGAARGLCNAYCDAMECSSETSPTLPEICDRVSTRFRHLTGEAIYCGDRLTITPTALVCRYEHSGLHIADIFGSIMLNGRPTGLITRINILDRDVGAPGTSVREDGYFMRVFDETAGGVQVYVFDSLEYDNNPDWDVNVALTR